MKKSYLPPESVFLNLPFEKKYERIFLGLIVGLVTMGLAPRSVLEIDENGDGRLVRLYNLIRECRISFHDLSYRGRERRYNMPFELGIAYAVTREIPHRILHVFESEPRDILKVLTDCRLFDPKRHDGKGELAMDVVHECFFSPSNKDPGVVGRKIYRKLNRELLKFRRGKPDIFNRRSFVLLVFEVKALFESYTSKSTT